MRSIFRDCIYGVNIDTTISLVINQYLLSVCIIDDADITWESALRMSGYNSINTYKSWRMRNDTLLVLQVSMIRNT